MTRAPSSALDVLARSVHIITNGNAEAREMQVDGTRRISAALREYEAASLQLPTGSGKALALLSAAAERCLNGERVLISTESLSLQKQVLEKDAPVMQQAVRELAGVDLGVAVLKGTNNYLDPRKLIAAGCLLAGLEDEPHSVDALITSVQKASRSRVNDQDLQGADWRLLRSLVLWGLLQYQAPDAPGDRHSCGLTFTTAEWAHVSATSAEATGADDYWLTPKVVSARERVAEADIVVVNHTLLAIQAAKGVPVVSGNINYGVFHHILVDEAHALPDEVRKQGAAEVSASRVHGVSRALKGVMAADEQAVFAHEGRQLADALSNALRGTLGRDEQLRLQEDENPLGTLSDVLPAWARKAGKAIAGSKASVNGRTALAAMRAEGVVNDFCAAVASVSQHRSGEARYLESGDWGVAAKSSPVDVAMKLRHNLFTRTDELTGAPVALGVACVSATLPTGFPVQVGIAAQTVEYESPFTEAHERSALYIPSGITHRDALLTSGRFDTSRHALWATGQIVELTSANGGSALILAATAKAGQAYVKALRERTNLTVHSQWDADAASVVSVWREDHSSVLVGTRSMMTGIDAPGETCSLVVLDRIPRKPGNPIDDARVESLMERGLDRWAAANFVYVADAALLEEQAKGRLVRAKSDRGVFACLDPRLLKYPRGAFPSYPEPARKAYMKPLYAFGGRFTELADATEYLRSRTP
ncbi:helicase C-terminal domain-containing protein [Microbacterium sp. 13-71-7]|jgi:ATP-dependent DNA helicase DinG|uniref:ATP-dependent DNA helicase n=1 Tax=Microbacterium sp. 13-71-7 TaxID=1970399 RepID=UPI0025E6AA58|nr:helicase C-terminal domain-containing protein [Microbacterium sp. 13-71-7]